MANYNEPTQIDPYDALFYRNRGHAHSAKEDYDSAIADFNKAIQLNPNDALSYLSRGFAYHNKEDYDNAIADFEKAIKLDPGNADAKQVAARAYCSRGGAYYFNGDYDRTITDLEKSLALDPDYTFARNLLEIARTQNPSSWDCVRLSESIRKSSKENSAGGLRPIVLKIYDIQETSRSPECMECSGRAKLSEGGERNIIFHIEKDEDGDIFYGYRLE